ncbi:MAG: family 2 glycosyl transferase [Proteobacteria bacterium]|nr:MAG: family 2 glycosyl transferase [Pseudomonadota bacterium]
MPFKVSIAMATYNGSAYIKEQIDSFIKQTRRPDELVITDDCSTDNTLAIIEDIQKKAPFKIIFSQNQERLGYSSNFNAALSRTTGDIIFLSDQDDVWFPEKIEKTLKLFSEKPEIELIINDVEITGEFLKPTGVSKLKQIQRSGYEEDLFVMGCAVSVRRSHLEMCLPIPKNEALSHDSWIVDIAQALGVKLINKEILQYYRRHENNTSEAVFNTTLPVKKLNVYKKAFSMRKKSNKLELLEKKIYIKELERIHSKIPIEFKEKLNLYIERKKSILALSAYRREIRKQKFTSRFFMSSKLLYQGDYKKANGFKSFLIDIITRSPAITEE